MPLTFLQFAFTGLLSSLLRKGRSGSGTPLRCWLILVALFYASSVTGNAALESGVSVPLHIILKSGGAVFSMLLGFLLFGKRYRRRQALSALLITAGVVAASMPNFSSSLDAKYSSAKGIALLAISAILASTMSLYQERVQVRYPSDWKESLFYTVNTKETNSHRKNLLSSSDSKKKKK